MSFISQSAIHHRNWNLILDAAADGSSPYSPSGGPKTLVIAWNNPDVPVEFSQTGVVPKFDPAMGTLTGISLTLTNNLNSSLELDCAGASFPKLISGNTSCDMETTCGIPGVDLLINNGSTIFISTAAHTGVFLASNGVNYPFNNMLNSVSATYNLNAFLASFIGAVGTVTFQADSFTANNVTNPIDVTLIANVLAHFSGSLTYTYTVP